MVVIEDDEHWKPYSDVDDRSGLVYWMGGCLGVHMCVVCVYILGVTKVA
jgi:hypothetical protein